MDDLSDQWLVIKSDIPFIYECMALGRNKSVQLRYHNMPAFFITCLFVCLFVLRFYGPVNPMGSCRARSVYLTTRLLGRLSPLSG